MTHGRHLFVAQNRVTHTSKSQIIFFIYKFFINKIFRKPDLDVDPENLKIREMAENGSVVLDNRFGEDEEMKCGQQLDDR